MTSTTDLFRSMRRSRQQLSERDCIAILSQATSGVLSLIGDGGYPYGVPMSFVFRNGHLYLHASIKGHKIDAIKACEKACFTIIAHDEIHGEAFTTYFRSVICFGRIRILSDEFQKLDAIRWLSAKYSQESAEAMECEIAKCGRAMCVLDFIIEHLTGKEAIELTRQRE